MSETTQGETIADANNATVSIEPDQDQEQDPEDELHEQPSDEQPDEQALPPAPAAHAPVETDAHATGEETQTTDAETQTATEQGGSPEEFYFGPVGKRRKPAAVLVLCVITFGLYGLVWHNRNNHELGDFDPQMQVHAARSTWAVVIPWLIGLLVTLAGAARIGLSAANVTLSFNPGFDVHAAYFLLAGLLVVPYLTLLLPFSYASVVMTAERIRIVEERVGLTTDVQVHPAAVGALLLIPLVGPLLLIGMEQRRINAAWQRITPDLGRNRS
jgi:hypothetical protein